MRCKRVIHFHIQTSCDQALRNGYHAQLTRASPCYISYTGKHWVMKSQVMQCVWGIYWTVYTEWNKQNKHQTFSLRLCQNMLQVKVVQTSLHRPWCNITTLYYIHQVKFNLPANKRESYCCAEYTDIERAGEAQKDSEVRKRLVNDSFV